MRKNGVAGARHTEGAATHFDGAVAEDIGHLVSAIDVVEDMATVDNDVGVATDTACRVAPGAGSDARAWLDGIVTGAATEDVAVEGVTVGSIVVAAAVGVVAWRVGVGIIDGIGCTIGPVGDFVEVKNSSMGDGAKASHLTYIGDSDVGKNVNLGCGVVFVNYDGSQKYRSVVDDNAFIGCNSNLISPIHIGEGAYVAAGSTITEDVPGGALYVARSRGRTFRDWVEKRGILKKRMSKDK